MRREKSVRAMDDSATEIHWKRKIIARFIWVMTFCLTAAVAHAQTYYVSPSGEDSNPGTAASPFRTINRALSVIGTIPGSGAGQTVEVAAGTYNEAIMFNLPSGSSWDRPFTLRARPGDVVTIKADGEVNIYIAEGIDYYSVIDGFVFDGANTWRAQVIIGSCCDPQPRSVRFQNNEFVNNHSGTFLISGDRNEILKNTVHGGFQEFTDCGQVHCFGYAFYVFGGASYNLLAENEIYDVASWVFHIYNSGSNSPHDNTVRNNLIHDFGYGDPRANGIMLSSGPRNVAFDNVLYNGSNGISAWRSCDGCVIFNNQISSMDRCIDVIDSKGVVVDGNNLNNCGSVYVNIIDAPALALTNTLCNGTTQNCQ